MKEKNLPTKYNYGEYSSDNYGAHSIAIDLPATSPKKYGITLYFSYNTIVAFKGFVDGEIRTFARVNDYGTTTGKHLNWLEPDHKKRLNAKDFEKVYKKALKNA